MEEDDMVMRVGSSLGRRRTDEESKEVLRASRRLALAAPKSSRACNRVRVKKDQGLGEKVAATQKQPLQLRALTTPQPPTQYIQIIAYFEA